MIEARPVQLFYSIFNRPVFCPAVITILPPARRSNLKHGESYWRFLAAILL
jgi:hypothetical protein